MAWKTVGEDSSKEYTTINKWQVAGQVVEGEYMGNRPGLKGLLFDVRGTDTQVSTYPFSTVLQNKFKNIKAGTLVRVEYLGKRRGKSGSEYQDFQVQVDDGDTLPQTKDGAEYDRVYSAIVKSKGDAVAKLISGAANGNLDSLLGAAAQLGVKL